METRDIVLLVIAAYVASMALVRMMLARHQSMLADFRRRIAAERARRSEEVEENSPADEQRERAA